MINLIDKALPNTIMVDGKAFTVKTDFRYWMRFEIELSKGQFPLEVAYLFDGVIPPRCSIEELLVFCRPKEELPRPLNNENVIALDYEYDSDLIYAAFLGQYGLDLTEVEYLHWHKFLALIKGLNGQTRLAEIMGYRCYKKNRNNDDMYEKLKYAWEVIREEENQEEIDAFSKAFTRKE